MNRLAGEFYQQASGTRLKLMHEVLGGVLDLGMGAVGLDPLHQHLEPAPDPGLLGLGQDAVL